MSVREAVLRPAAGALDGTTWAVTASTNLAARAFDGDPDVVDRLALLPDP